MLNRFVPGEGPAPCPTMLVGEAPGPQEHDEGRPFVGKAGAVLDSLIAHEGLKRSQLYITNLVKRWPGPRNPDPTPAEIERDEPLLLRELENVRPSLVIALGRFALRWFLPGAELETHQGIPHVSPRGPICIGVTHPAAGLHEPGAATQTYLAWSRACRYLRGPSLPWSESISPPPCMRYLEPQARLVVSEPVALDTEGTPGEPFSVQWTADGLTGFCVPASHAHRLVFDAPVIFHNAKYDVLMCESMRVTLPSSDLWEDTMVRAYVRQDEPQGLKPLAYRLLRMHLSSFSEVTEPYYKLAVERWLARIGTEVPGADQRPQPQLIRASSGLLRPHRPFSLASRVRAILQAREKRPNVDVVERWRKVPASQRESAERALGPMPRRSLALVPREQAVPYGIMDAIATHKLARAYRVPASLQSIYRLDVECIPALIEMERNGLPFDARAASELCAELDERANALRKRIRRLAGDPWFNPGSHRQVSALLFGLWGIASPRKTKLTRADSSDDRALSTLRLRYAEDESASGKRVFELVTAVQDYREHIKLIGTYVGPDALPAQVDERGFIHPTIKHTRTVSGRLASENPNLQNVPVRTGLGRRIRACFRAPDGWCLLSGDLSQIELRIAAHESGDERLIRVYREGLDLHRITERDVFGIPDERAGEKRTAAKNFNFRVLYAGPIGSPAGLREQLFLDGITLSEDECRRYRDAWFALYPGVARYLSNKHEEARRLAYVSTSGGRRRYLPLARVDAVPSARNEAFRQAGNHPIQGGAGEVIKRAMVRWDREYRERANRMTEVRLCMQIHDELLFLVRGEPESTKARRAARLVVEMLEADSRAYRVPIVAEAKVGNRWGEQKKLEVRAA